MPDDPAPEIGQSKAKVFISYSRKDMAFADRLDAALKARGFEPLIDRTDILALEEWWKRIEVLIGRADTVVFVLSPDAVRPESIARKEVAFAASLNKRFAPIVFRPVEDKLVPDELAKLNFIFFDDPARFEQSADQLAEALNTDVSWIRQHTDFGEQARQWSQAKGASGLLLRSPVLEQAERWIASRPPGAPAPTEVTQAFIRQSRHRATRRRRVLTGSLAAGLVLALALVGLAYWQRQIAEDRRIFAEQQQAIAVEQRSIAQQNEAQAREERDNATRNLKLAHQTADKLVFDIAQELRNVQGMRVESVRKILETAKSTIEQLSAAAPHNLEIQMSRGAMLSEFGQTSLILGDLESARQYYEESLAISERMVRANPNYPDDPEPLYGQVRFGVWQHNLAISHMKIGDVLTAMGQRENALAAYRKSLEISQQLANSGTPRVAEWQRDVAISYSEIGNTLWASNRYEEALAAYQESLAIRQQLADSDPPNSDLRRDLFVAYNRVGDALMALSQRSKAQTAFEKSLSVAQRLADNDPANTLALHDLALTYHRIADMLLAVGKPVEALETYWKSVTIGQQLVDSDPGNKPWQRDLSVSHNKVGDALAASGKRREALAAYQKSLTIRQQLANSDPDNEQWRRDLQVCIHRIGNLAFQFVLANDFAKGLETADQSIKLAPHLTRLYTSRAHALMFLGRVDEARALYLQYAGVERVLDAKSWATVILEDFAELRKTGLSHPLMDEIESKFLTRG